MSIQALSHTTVRLIGASQAITDPTSIVKELIDNALDARATAVFIEISANTIETILVRDNGHGVAPEDRNMICRRYCTSKIRDYADLESVGGKTLGFRGEALASSAELSDTLLVTTRVDGEETGVTLKISRNGEIQSRDRASHPVGTSVRVTNLFENIPVRKQTALKNCSKCIAKIRRCVQGYAFARPSVRFSLKILKAKNEKGNWMYAPKFNGNAEDAAFKIVGQECASQCAWTTVLHGGFQVQSFLPTANANIPKINNMGHFVSVDARPVSAVRGVLKQTITKIKDRLKASLHVSDSIKDPFIFLNLVCSPNSYDPNVEPAKDDVMFANEAEVLDAVHKLLDLAFPRPIENEASIVLSSPNQMSERHPLASIRNPPTEARRETASLSIDSNIAWSDAAELSDLRPSKRQCRLRTNMYGIDESDLDIVGVENETMYVDSNHGDPEHQSTRDAGIEVSNPWIIAKMAAPLRRSQHRPPTPPLQMLSSSDANTRSSDYQTSFPEKPPWAPPTPDTNSLPLEPESRIDTRPLEGVACSMLNEQSAQQTCIPVQTRKRTMDDSEEDLSLQDRSEYPLQSLSVHRGQERHAGRSHDFMSAADLPRDSLDHAAHDSSSPSKRVSQNRVTRVQKPPPKHTSTPNPSISPIRVLGRKQDHQYLRSSPPTLPANYGFTPINRYYPPNRNNNSEADGSPDVQNFLDRIRNVGTNQRRNHNSRDQVSPSEDRIEEAVDSSDTTSPMPKGTSSSRNLVASNSSSTQLSSAMESPERFKAPAHATTNRPHLEEPAPSELHNLVRTLRISIELLASLTFKLERLNLSNDVFSIHGPNHPSETAINGDQSTFVCNPPEPREMEDWRRQLVHFVQQAGAGRGVNDVGIYTEEAVAAAAAVALNGEESCSETVSDVRAEGTVCSSSQGSDMLLT